MYLSTNKIGPSTLPCGMPLVTGFQVELAPFMHTCCTRSDKKAFIHWSVSVLIRIACSSVYYVALYQMPL